MWISLQEKIDCCNEDYNDSRESKAEKNYQSRYSLSHVIFNHIGTIGTIGTLGDT